MRWKVHGRRTMYESDWVNVYLDDVELPDGTHIDHHVLTMPKASQTAVVLNDTADQVLLIRRHRFITNSWGWEVPAGWVEPGEDAEAAIRREILEETGHSVSRVQPLMEYDAIPGISSIHFKSWLARGAHAIAVPDSIETNQVEWHPVAEVIPLIVSGGVSDGPSLTALSYFLAVSGLESKP